MTYSDYCLNKLFYRQEAQMRRVTATDPKERPAAVLDAAQREPVVIRRQKREVTVILSPRGYDSLRARNADEFQQFCDRCRSQPSLPGEAFEGFGDRFGMD
jgi:antitoxin Phd